MIHYMLFWVHIFILPISRDRELKKIPRLLTVGTNWTLFHLLVWKQQHKLHKPTVIWGAAGLLEPLWKKKKIKITKAIFLYKTVQKWNPCQNETWVQRNCFHDSWEDLKDKLEGLGEKACPRTSALTQQTDLRVTFHQTFSISEDACSCSCSKWGKKQSTEKMLRAQGGDFPSAPQKQDAIIPLLLMVNSEGKFYSPDKTRFLRSV